MSDRPHIDVAHFARRVGEPMDIREYNRRAWDRQVEEGNRWTVPVGPAVTAAARRGE